MRKVLLVFSDTHGGSKLGLLNPETTLDNCTYGPDGLEHDYWKPSLNGIQKLLWKQYTEDIKKIKKWAKKDELIVVHNGDITQGNKYSNTLVDEKQSSQVRVAVNNMRPWFELENLSTFIIIDGTSSHEFGDGSSADLVARELADGKVRVERRRHAVLNIDGLRVDVAHHGPGVGGRAWLRGNQLTRYARSICMDEMLEKKPAPDVIIRSHYHDYEHEETHVKNHNCFICVTPCFSGMNHYATQATASAYKLSVGMIAFEIIDGELGRRKELVETYDLRQEIEL